MGILSFQKYYFPGLPIVLRYTAQVKGALMLSMNTHHESRYCEGSEYVNLSRFYASIPPFEDVLVHFCVPIWFEFREWSNLANTLLPHLKTFVPSVQQVYLISKGPT